MGSPVKFTEPEPLVIGVQVIPSLLYSQPEPTGFKTVFKVGAGAVPLLPLTIHVGTVGPVIEVVTGGVI